MMVQSTKLLARAWRAWPFELGRLLFGQRRRLRRTPRKDIRLTNAGGLATVARAPHAPKLAQRKGNGPLWQQRKETMLHLSLSPRGITTKMAARSRARST